MTSPFLTAEDASKIKLMQKKKVFQRIPEQWDGSDQGYKKPK